MGALAVDEVLLMMLQRVLHVNASVAIKPQDGSRCDFTHIYKTRNIVAFLNLFVNRKIIKSKSRQIRCQKYFRAEALNVKVHLPFLLGFVKTVRPVSIHC